MQPDFASASMSLTLRAAFDEYTKFRLRGSRDTTRKKFGYALDHWSALLAREPTLGDLSDASVVDALWWMVETRGVKPVTANGYGAKIRALWNFAARRGMLTTWPTFQRLPEDAETPVAFSRQQLSAVFLAIDETPGKIGDIHARDWWRSLCLTLWDSAERIAATLSARWCDLTGEFLTIRAAERKGKLGRRKAATYRLHSSTLAAIEAIRMPERELLWPWPYCTASLWNHWDRILKRANVPVDRYHQFHCFRRSVASYAQADGMDASALLDHTDRRVTERYLSPQIVQRPAACDVLFRPGESCNESANSS